MILRILLLLLFAATTALGQLDSRRFYRLDGVEVMDSTMAAYCEWYEGGRLFSVYTSTGAQRVDEVDTNEEGLSLRTYFYPDGDTMFLSLFEIGEPVGLLKAYYPDGKPHVEMDFVRAENRDPSHLGDLIVSYWDSTGVQQVVDGNGQCTYSNIPFYDIDWQASGKVINGLKQGHWSGVNKLFNSSYEEEYKDGKLISGTMTRRGVKYEYDVIHKYAQPEGGMSVFYDMLVREMTYPARARRKGIQGKVFVEFWIRTDGHLNKVRAIKGIDDECDEIAVQTVLKSPRWNPGVERGETIESRVVLPINFTIGFR